MLHLSANDRRLTLFPKDTIYHKLGIANLYVLEYNLIYKDSEGGGYGDKRYHTRTRMIMKQCPYCGSELPDDKSAFYCVKCDHILDEDILLRQEIKKELEKTKPVKGKAKNKKATKQPAVNNNRNNNNKYYSRIHYEEKKSYANVVFIAIVVILILYVLYK